MSVTVEIRENPAIRLSDEHVEVRRPDAISFAVEGVLTMTEPILRKFEGRTLTPVCIEMSVDDGTVEVDLRDGANLRLETIDVGVGTPETEPSVEADSVRSTAEDGVEASRSTAGSIAFTVEGVVEPIVEEVVDELGSGTLALESISFGVEESVRSDGGSGTDVVVEFVLLGFSVSVRHDGVIVVAQGSRPDSALL